MTTTAICAGCGSETLSGDVIVERVEDMAALLAAIGAAVLPPRPEASETTENFLVRLNCGHWSLMKVHDSSRAKEVVT